MGPYEGIRNYSHYFCRVNRSGFKIYGVLTLVGLLYGANYNILKIVTPSYVKPYGFIVCRVIITTIFFWIFFLFSKQKIRWKEDGLRLVLCAFTGVVVNQLLFFKGISLTSAINASIIMTLTPVLVLIWSSILIKEKITSIKIVGILVGLIGAILIVSNGNYHQAAGNAVGDLLVFVNGMSYGCYLVLVRPLMTKYKPLTVMVWIFSIGAFFVIPVGWREAMDASYAAFPDKIWLSMAYAIVGVTLVAYFLNSWALIRVDASVVGAFIYLQPVFATLTATLFFEEIFYIKHLVACLFIFTGVWLVTR